VATYVAVEDRKRLICLDDLCFQRHRDDGDGAQPVVEGGPHFRVGSKGIDDHACFVRADRCPTVFVEVLLPALHTEAVPPEMILDVGGNDRADYLPKLWVSAGESHCDERWCRDAPAGP
jgi:hypothetical protein